MYNAMCVILKKNFKSPLSALPNQQMQLVLFYVHTTLKRGKKLITTFNGTNLIAAGNYTV